MGTFTIEEPFPIPGDMNPEWIDRMQVVDGAWREDRDYRCRRCGAPAYLNPYTNAVWGCRKCVFTTRSVFVHFKPSLPPEDLVVRFMCFAQKRGVRMFPPFTDRAWQEFMRNVRGMLGDLLPGSTEIEIEDVNGAPRVKGCDNIAFLLRFSASVAPFGKGMRVRKAPWAKDLSREFPELAERMFSLAEATPGLLKR